MAEKNYRTVAVVPESPRTIDDQQLHIYVPQGTTSTSGIFKPDGEQFVITANGVLRVDASKLIQLATPSAQVVEDGGETSAEVQFTETDHTLLRQFQFTFKNIKGATGATGAQGDVGLAALECFVRASGPTSLLPKVGSEHTFEINKFNRKPLFGELSTYYYQASDTGYVYLIQMMVSLVTSTNVKNTITMVSQLSGTDGDNALIYSDTYTESTAGDVADKPIHLELANFSRTPVKGDTFVLVYYTTDTQQTTIALFSIYDIQDTYAEAQLVLGTQHVITGPQGKQGETGAAGAPGADGVSITSVTQTGVQGGTLVTITLSNGQSTSFTVYNGINTNFQVVDELPTENISTSTIYLILADVQSEDNIYDEYIYVNGDWEHIGSTSVDLSDYVTKTYFNQNVGDATKNYVVAQIAKVHNLYIEMYESGSVPVVGQALTLTNANFARVPTQGQYFGLLEVVNTKDKYYSVCQILSVDTNTCSAKVVAVTELDNGTEIEAIKQSIAALTTTVNGKADASALNSKLDKVTSATSVQQAYVKNANGVQDMVNVDIEETPDSIVKRRNNGTIDCNDGTNDLQAATVGQMNTAIAAAQPYHITLTGYTGTVTQEQYDKLKVDDKSYIVFTNDNIVLTKGKQGLGYYGSTGIAQWVLTIQASLSYTCAVINIESTTNKKNAITGEGNDTDYPTTKAVADYVAANKAYHITINSITGSILQTEYDSLKNDKSSYVILDNSASEGSFEIYCFKRIDSNNSLLYECVFGSTARSLAIDEHGNYNIKTAYYELTSHKVTSLSSTSTDTQYPSAKATYDADQSTLTAAKSYADSILGAEQAWLQKITTGEGV